MLIATIIRPSIAVYDEEHNPRTGIPQISRSLQRLQKVNTRKQRPGHLRAPPAVCKRTLCSVPNRTLRPKTVPPISAQAQRQQTQNTRNSRGYFPGWMRNSRKQRWPLGIFVATYLASCAISNEHLFDPQKSSNHFPPSVNSSIDAAILTG